MNSPQNFLHGTAKTFVSCPGQMRQAVASLPLRQTALKRVKVKTSGEEQQVPAKRQNRGPGNSTGDGF
ncbi:MULTISPECIES: single-stranded DNA-binding protein [Klebsiella]|uniref:single-stranded DNA-binding protein n=1 Tax=Klebsiella TaxID=570 RepID=UPI00163B948D|nr:MULTISPECIES: single-stranded DNA-binding protein [Klebsiella]HDH7817972.1 single-stranded DNA-binding protein [Raoultella ornithinolytica]HDS8778840.1 single-stranded DNA-binding protein [Klebsiella michiganensis]MBW6011504.1 single-stranded DNA-binding protein [Klebsiella sp. CVUAS 11263]MBW6032844.1 single-stranded DNA-binding protein [Klebsiella sp. CVUAS 11332]HDT5148034.1 single-stranded DNA-binding protein [Klebsiella michiganensis]